uniref:Protein JASON isoform X2 n=1 Tax=Elaeis guineensis var. tenera TaxID=51953 RepID=A0A8N4F1G7_ELAGV|nr:protein JASON isoform X2 [Elaeis guineensis]
MKRCKFRVIKEVLGFLEAALMGCFFACFRIKNDEDGTETRLSTNSIPFKNRDRLVSKNHFDAVSLCEEKGSPCVKVRHPSLQEDLGEGSISRDLEHEAKYLKSCGALLETPAEIQRASGKIVVQTPQEDGVHLDFHSWLPVVPCKKLQWDEQVNPISDSPAQVDNSDYLEHISRGCNSDERQILAKVVQCEEIKHVSAVESIVESVMLDISPSKAATKVAVLDSNDSPYPTPLNLTDEMQTPGTVHPTNQENIRARKNGRIRTQYVYPVLKPVENISHWKAPREETSLTQSADHSEKEKKIPSPDFWGRGQQISFTPVPADSKLFDSSSFSSPNEKISQVQNRCSREESVHDNSLSSPALLFKNEDEIRNSENIAKEKPHSEKSSDAGRPIIGIVASHWNADDLSHISWDGNGIPNTTTKYKENQKVSWHAAPLEDRLEKALSDEKLLPKRKLLNGRPVEFD